MSFAKLVMVFDGFGEDWLEEMDDHNARSCWIMCSTTGLRVACSEALLMHGAACAVVYIWSICKQCALRHNPV